MIYFFGDTHGHFDHVLEIVSREGVQNTAPVVCDRPRMA